MGTVVASFPDPSPAFRAFRACLTFPAFVALAYWASCQAVRKVYEILS